MQVIILAMSRNTLRSLTDKRRASESIGLNRNSVIEESATIMLKMFVALWLLVIRTANKEISKRLVDVMVHTMEDFK